MPADPTQLKKDREFGLPGIAFCAARVPATERFYFGSSDAKVYAIDLADEKPQAVPLAEDGHTSYVTGAALSGNTLLTGGYDKQLLWWNVESNEIVRREPAHELWIRKIIASPDGRAFVSIADDMRAKVWSAGDGQLVRTLEDHQPLTPHHYPSMLYAVAWSPDGRYLATGDKVGHVAVWDASSFEKVGEVEAPLMYTWDPKQRRHSIGGIRSLAFSHDSKLLAVGGIGTIGNIDHLDGPHRIEVFDWQAKERKLEISNNELKGLVECLAFAPDGTWLAAAGGDHGGFVAFYKVENGESIKAEKAPMHVYEFTFSDDGETLYTIGHGKLATWKLSPA